MIWSKMFLFLFEMYIDIIYNMSTIVELLEDNTHLNPTQTVQLLMYFVF